MKKFEKEIVVTEAEWKAELDAYLARELRELEAEDLEDKPFEAFFKTGDMAKFIDDCLAEGSNPNRGWGFAFVCNPNRDYELLKRNIKTYWDWILKDNNLEKYVPDILIKKGKDKKESVFLRRMNSLGTVNSPVLDPVCAAKLFLWVYGEEFEATRNYPMPLGQCEWVPQIEVDADERFTDMVALIGSYLFDGSDIADRQSLALVDYWFSIVPHLKDLRIFDVERHVDRDMEYPRKQKVVRAFFMNMLGFDAYEKYDELPHVDPELEQYVRSRLAETDMPGEYYRMLKYIEEHKERSKNNLEDDD